MMKLHDTDLVSVPSLLRTCYPEHRAFVREISNHYDHVSLNSLNKPENENYAILLNIDFTFELSVFGQGAPHPNGCPSPFSSCAHTRCVRSWSHLKSSCGCAIWSPMSKPKCEISMLVVSTRHHQMMCQSCYYVKRVNKSLMAVKP